MDERWLKKLIYLIVALVLGGTGTAMPASISPQGDIITEYVYGEEFVQPAIYCKSVLEFLNSKVLDASKLKVSGYNANQIGKQTITIKYLYTEYNYDVTVVPLALALPEPVIDGEGILTLSPGEKDYPYIDRYDITVGGVSVDAGDIVTEYWGQSGAHAQVDLAAVMQTLGLPPDEEYMLSVRTIGKTGGTIENSTAVTKTMRFVSLGSVLAETPVLNWVDEVTRDQIRLNWDYLSAMGEDGAYLLNIEFYKNESSLGSQQRDAGKMTAGSTVFFTSGAISLNRLMDGAGNTLLADKAIIHIVAVGSAERVFGYSGAGDKVVARFVISVSGGELLLEEDLD